MSEPEQNEAQLHVTDDEQWACGRPVGGYRGTFPRGFLERINSQLGIPIYNEDVLYTFGGAVKSRDNWHTNDIRKGELTGPDEEPLQADTAHDARDLPLKWTDSWPIVIADPPYSEQWSEELYNTDYPRPCDHFREATRVVQPGGYVLVLDTLVYSLDMAHDDHPVEREQVVTVTCGPKTTPRALNIFRKPNRLDQFGDSND